MVVRNTLIVHTPMITLYMCFRHTSPIVIIILVMSNTHNSDFKGAVEAKAY